MPDSNSNSRCSLRWLVFSSSTYYLYAFVASILAVLISLLIWNWNEALLINVGLPLACCLTLSFALEQLLNPRPVWPWQRPVAAVILHKGLCLLVFAPLLLLLQRPWFCCISILALQVLVVMISNAKYHSLQEPFIYQDFSYFVDALRFPRLYLPFLGTGRALLAGVAICIAIYGGLVVEQPLCAVYSFRQISALAVVLVSIGLLLVLLGRSVRFRLTLDPVADLQQLGLLPCLWGYYRAEQQPWQGVDLSRLGTAAEMLAGPLPNLVVIQSESFFDPRRWHRDITPDLLQHYDDLKQSAASFGPLEVPAWGANTVRTEFAFLSGIANHQLGVHRFKPYRRVARQGLPTLVSNLKQQGYRTVCLHPYSATFYDRATVFPLLGFDEFIDSSRFSAADYHGQYVGDLAVARELCAELAKHDGPGAQPLFVFVITMENHGPLHLEQARPEDRQRLVSQTLPDGSDDLIVYLRHLEQADQMLGKVQDTLAAMQREGWLCLYGDHLPIMPQVYRQMGEPDGRVDYLVWSNHKQLDGAGMQPLAVEQLARELLQKAGLMKRLV